MHCFLTFLASSTFWLIHVTLTALSNNNTNNKLTFKKCTVNENRDDKKTESTNWTEKSSVNVWNSPETQMNDTAQTTVTFIFNNRPW